LQSNAALAHTQPAHVSSVHAFPSSHVESSLQHPHRSAFHACEHPCPGTQASSVHWSPSSHDAGACTHVPTAGSHVSVVHGSPSLHDAGHPGWQSGFGSWTQTSSTHLSMVHGSPSMHHESSLHGHPGSGVASAASTGMGISKGPSSPGGLLDGHPIAKVEAQRTVEARTRPCRMGYTPLHPLMKVTVFRDELQPGRTGRSRQKSR
jgi:hypothetical protein